MNRSPPTKRLNNTLRARQQAVDIAAMLDRINAAKGGRGASPGSAHRERFARPWKCSTIKAAAARNAFRQIFSLVYDATWEKPKPR